jgi:hypothetical protein
MKICLAMMIRLGKMAKAAPTIMAVLAVIGMTKDPSSGDTNLQALPAAAAMDPLPMCHHHRRRIQPLLARPGLLQHRQNLRTIPWARQSVYQLT